MRKVVHTGQDLKPITRTVEYTMPMNGGGSATCTSTEKTGKSTLFTYRVELDVNAARCLAYKAMLNKGGKAKRGALTAVITETREVLDAN
jgi:hypothetical protein